MDEPTPMARYRLDSTDPDEAIEYLRAAYTWFDAAPVAGEGFVFSLEGVGSATLELAALHHSAPLAASCEPPERLVAAVSDHPARSRVTDGREDVHDTVLLAPAMPYEIDTQGPLATRTVAIDRHEVARVGAELTGLDAAAVAFRAMAPRSPLLGRYWADLTAHLGRDVLAHDALLEEPLVHVQTVRALATALLTVFPNTTHTLDPAARRDTADPATVRRAVEYIDAHAHEPITVTDIAAAAGVGPRGLQHAFLRHREVTPLSHLRRVRLHRAHTELVAADPLRGDTVAAVAARWGFANPGRFAVHYRQSFGCSPSITLRR